MKCGMNTHGFGKLESDRNRGYESDDLEWTDEPGGKLPGFGPEWDVFGGEPNLLAWGVVRGRGAMAIREALI